MHVLTQLLNWSSALRCKLWFGLYLENEST